MTTPAPSNFSFIGKVWPALLNDCLQAERSALSDPRVASFRARHVLERIVRHIWEFRNLGNDDGSDLFALLKSPSFTRIVPKTQIDKMHVIRQRGNDAVHGDKPVSPQSAANLLMHLFDVLSWATAQHSAHPEARPTVPFDQKILAAAPKQQQISRLQLNKLAKDLEDKEQDLRKSALLLDAAEQQRLEAAEKLATEKARFEKLRAQTEAELAETTESLKAAQARAAEIEAERDAEIAQLRAQLRQQQESQAGQGLPPALPPTLNEAQTRKDLIDPMLERAGFVIGHNVTVEHPVTGMPISAENHSGKGFVDYVLWDDDGLPLALIEAKKSSSHLSEGAIQASLYADRLEADYGRRPVIFTTNGHIVQISDDAANLPISGSGYPTRPVEGYPTVEQLRTIIHRRTHRRDLSTLAIDPDIAGRDYQQQVIRNVTEALQTKQKRSTLLVMATGTGKTRVAIATSKLLREAGWIKKVLFLADRTALVDQAHENFVHQYPDSAPVNLLNDPEGVGQIYVSTYQTMMSLISDDGTTPAKFSPFDFDLVIVDEAHRSIYHRFRRILDYFDAYVLGLTATPKNDVHRDTYLLFGIEDRVPTGAYTLEQAIKDKHLVPYKVLTRDSLFLRSGVRYDELSEEDQARWDALDWGVDDAGDPLAPPDGAHPAEINSRLYNRDTIRKVLSTLVERGIKTDGDHLGKTIIFARTQQHAELIGEEWNRYFVDSAPQPATIITHSTKYASAAIKELKNPRSGMNIAVSVDMLDTGIDVPEIVNLVFFRPVYSATKFWQMMGRGTRLRPNLFAEGIHKKEFYVFDFCGNAENFLHGEQPDTSAAPQASLSERIFLSRAQLSVLLPDSSFRSELRTQLHQLVKKIPPGHILVRPQDKSVLEHYQRPESWTSLSAADVERLSEHIAGLPMGTMAEKESAKRFDLLILQLQVGLFQADESWVKNQQKVEKIAVDLLAVDNINAVTKAHEILDYLTNPEWWESVTVEDLEVVRKKVRGLLEYLPRNKRNTVITDIEDEFGDVAEVELPASVANAFINIDRVEDELRKVLEQHSSSTAMQKLRTARPLTDTDVQALESMIADAALEGIDELRETMGGDSIPAFIRRLVGLDEEAVREEFADLIKNSTFSANQISFIKKIEESLVKVGHLEFAGLFQEPFTAYGNVIDLFNGNQAIVLDLKTRIERINNTTGASG